MTVSVDPFTLHDVRWLGWQGNRTREHFGDITVGSDGCLADLVPKEREPFRERGSLRGRWVLPAFCDSHTHFLYGAYSRSLCWFDRELDGGAALGELQQHAVNPDGWMLGAGFGDPFVESPPDVDAFGNTPVFLFSADHHQAWINRSAAECLSQPAGILREQQGMQAWYQIPRTVAELDEEVQRMHALGISALASFDGGESVAELRQRPLPLRVLHSVPWPVASETATVVNHDLWRSSGPGELRVCWAKLFLDGTLGSRTAWLTQAYEDAPGVGLQCVSDVEWRRQLPQLAASGLSLALHAIGDAAVERALDWIEQLRAVRGPSPYDRIEHAELLSEPLLDRLADADVVLSMQPCHLTQDLPLAATRWGERCRYLMPFKSLRQRRIPLVFGTDSPIASLDPWRNLDAARRRRGDEGLDFDESWWIATRGVPRANPLPSAWGTMQPGAPADLQIVELEHPRRVRHRGGVRVRALLIEGHIVYGTVPQGEWQAPAVDAEEEEAEEAGVTDDS